MKDIQKNKVVIDCDSLSEEERIQINNEKKEHGGYQIKKKIGYVTFKNNWGATISEVTIRHRLGNDPNKEEISQHYGLLQGDETVSNEFKYEVGVGSSFDYWWIKFIVGNNEYKIKKNFYCSVDADDDGNVLLIANGDNSKLHVQFSSSSSCDVSISQVR